MLKTITSSFFTTTNVDSFRDSLRFLCNPYNRNKFNTWKWNDIVEKNLNKYLWSTGKIISFYNARSALYHWLKAFEIWKGNEVILQAYTCVSVPNSIIQTWAKPIYVDIAENSLNIDINKIESKINKNTKAIIIQHTFWSPAKINQIKNICKKHNLFLIEDCAHSLWAEFEWKKVWTFWDFAIFSFGRDKVISTVNWWFLLVNNSKYFNKIEKIKLAPINSGSDLKNVPIKLILKNLFYLIVSYLSYKLYDFSSIWKALILFCKKTNLIPEILSCNEKKCQDTTFFYKYPNALAYIAIKEIEKIDLYNIKRVEIAEKYNQFIGKWKMDLSSNEGNGKWRSKSLNNTNIFPSFNVSIFPLTNSINLRYVLLTTKVKELTKKCKQAKILLWDRYRQVIAPEHTNFENAYYQVWSCPVAEKFASQTVNLPCHPNLTDKDVNKVQEILKTLNH